MIATAPNFAYIDKMPPANIDAEEAILGGILLDSRALDVVSNIICPEAFSLDSHYRIYKAFLSMREEKIPIDGITVTNWLESHELLKTIGGQSKLAQLMERTVSAVNVDAYAELIHDKYLRRQLIQAGSRLWELAYNEQLSSALAEGESLLSQIERAQRGNPKAALLEKIKAIRGIESPVEQIFAWDRLSAEVKKNKKYLIELALAAEADSDLEVYSAKQFSEIKFAEAKYLIGGLIRQGTVALIAAEAKTGKSLFHYNLAYHAATGESWGDFLIEKPYKTLIVQTDESQIEAQERVICRGLADLPNVEVVTRFSPFQLSRLRKRIIADKIQFVIFDSLTSINRTSGYSPNDAEYGYFCYELKEMAEELGISILLVHHTNKCPIELGLDKIAGSATITRAVSDIFMLSRSKQQEDPETTRILYHAASRSGGQKTWKIELSPEDFSWSVTGRCNLEGAADQSGDNNDQGEIDQSLQIQNFLRAAGGTGFEIQEISRETNIPLASCRRICGQLTRQLRVGRRRSTINRRAYVYFWPESSDHASQLSDHGDHHDHFHDHLENSDGARNTAPSDHVITKNPEKKSRTDAAQEKKSVDPRSHDHFEPKPIQGEENTSDHGSDHGDHRDHLNGRDHLIRDHFKVGDRIVANWPEAKKAAGVIKEINSKGKLVITWDNGKLGGEGLIPPSAALHESAIASWMPECSTPTEALGIKARLFTSPKLHALPWTPEELGRSTWIDLESGNSEDWEAVRDRLDSHPYCRIDHLPEEYQILWFDWVVSKE